MSTAAAILTAELRRVHGVHLTEAEMAAILRTAGLTLTGGAKQAVDEHLTNLKRLTGAATCP